MSLGSLAGVSEASASANRASASKHKPLAVCHIASGDRWAGAEVQIANLLNNLSGNEKIQVCAIVLNEGRLAEEARRCGLEVKVISERDKSFFQIYSEAAGFLKGRGISVLHSHRYKENLLASFLAWRCDIPVVIRTQHGLPEPFTGLKRYKHGLIQFLDRLTARYATDCVIGVSAEMRDHLIRQVGSHRVSMIHNGLDVTRVYSGASTQEAKKKLGVQESCWVLGTAGRLEPIKRLDIFLEAACRISVRFPDARFLVAGTGSEEARLRELARTFGIEDRVLFLGHRDDIHDVLRAMDVFVLSSDHEGLPMVLLEALHLGVPVVARRVGGIPEVIQDGINGTLVDSGDSAALAEACLDILSDEPRRRRLALAGVNSIAEKFTAKHAATEVARLYQALWGVE
jgi:glycosyltransferase involved in cell wall biosynthesis